MGEDQNTEKSNAAAQADPKETDAEVPASATENFSSTTIGQPTSKHTNSIAFVILAAVVIAVGLLGLGFLAYNAKEEPAQPATTQTTDEESTGSVQESDLDQEAAEIDQTTQELDNSSDFNEQNLNDENIGL